MLLRNFLGSAGVGGVSIDAQGTGQGVREAWEATDGIGVYRKKNPGRKWIFS